MPTVSILDATGKKSGTLEVKDELLDAEINLHTVREALTQYLANQRQGTASTKARGQTHGGGRKPWRQKGTGRARAGSIRSPLWRGGAVTFGPQPRDYRIKVNKRKKRQALCSALTALRTENKLFVLERLELEEPKTKLLVQLLNQLKLQGKTLILLDGNAPNVVLAGRNLADVTVSQVENINIFDLLYHDNLVTTKEAIKKLEEALA
jgi:large subunit ribosomal protein L4